MFGIKFVGEANFHKALHKFDDAKIEKALDLMALATEREAKIRCPVRTGRLRNSITTAKRKKVRYVGTSVHYAFYVHNGTYKMPARPFLLQGFEAMKRKYKTIIEKAFT